MPNVELNDLPDEVLVNFISYLDARGMDSCSRACKRFYRVMHNSVVLKYLLARNLAGFIDVGPPSSPVIERYNRLQAHESNWRRLQWKKKSILSLDASLGAYEMNGGVFAYSSRGNESIVFTVLSSVPDKHNLIQWQQPVNGLDMMDFTFNCDLNLLCLIVRDYGSRDSPFAIHLRTMTGDNAHPEAQCPVLRCPPDCRYYWPARFDLETALIEFTVQVYHDHVACLYQLSAFGGKDMVVVWNWRSGQVVKIVSPPLSDQGQYTDMSFLTSNCLLVCQLGPCASLNVVTWGLGIHGDMESTLKLQLPEVNKNYAYTRIQHHSNPSPSPSRPPSIDDVDNSDSEPPRKRRRRSPIPSARAFVASGEDRLLAFSTNIQKRNEIDITHTSGLYYLFFLSEKKLKAFLKTQRVPQYPIGTPDNERSSGHPCPYAFDYDGPPSLRWAEWGPQQVRWIPSARTYGWAVCSRGMRFVCSPPLEFEVGFNSQVMLLDFQVPGLEEEEEKEECEDSEGEEYDFSGPAPWMGKGRVERGWRLGLWAQHFEPGRGANSAEGNENVDVKIPDSMGVMNADHPHPRQVSHQHTASGSSTSTSISAYSTSSAATTSSSSSSSSPGTSYRNLKRASPSRSPYTSYTYNNRLTSALPPNAKLVHTPSVLPNTSPKVFEEEVVSTLPYLQVISEEWLTDSVGFMMDEESIISVKVSEHEISALEVMRFTPNRVGGR